ncbi:diguanylate cyclase [Leptolyngbya sp. FACHB-36]|uniref:histidine kinase N-terminal 7TM domain-containing diguanylate cyclase n=1 Tax=Leptolyngbya sp. FACHB-36 TaxID=2692808 RepID=UPI0016801BC3|nr:histidine kinase N-terminal 7TM domain-containing protein [Leptolyngbya sp. FACHB-36]MBD2019966.1 diguanylate cyclase [Leptolyngbya sp. FACHB-36]
MFQLTLQAAVLGLTTILSVTVAVAAWQRRSNSPASTPFIQMMLAIAGYSLAAALEASAIELSDKIIWSKLEYVGSGSVITLFLVFAAQFTHSKRWLTPRTIALLWLLPLGNVGLVATNERHQLIWSDFLPGPSSNLVIYQHGPGFFWVMVCTYTYTLAGSLLLVKAALRSSILYRQQSKLALAGALVPLLGGSAYVLKLSPPGLNITPMSFLLTGLIFFASLFRFRLFDLVPVARDSLIERMSDGVLVLDVRNRIIDLNPAAHRLIGASASCIGRSIDQVFTQWHDFAKSLQEDVEAEIWLDSMPPLFVELRMTTLHDRRRRLTGRLLILRDITQRHQAETALRQANEHLQSQLLEIEALQSQLQEQAIRDGLTNLFNRRYFEETLPRELARAAREGYSVAVIFMDIDYFKRINDTFGHQAGDRVLQAFAALLRSQCRSSDIPCRYGGEEFVLALPDVTLKCAHDRAEQIRLAFQAVQVRFGETQIDATVSGGVGIFPDHGETSSDLLRAIDRALYAAKADGRNCVKQAGQPL